MRAPMPLHYQIASELRQALQQGRWNVGDLFPTDKELMQKYGVSSTTVRRAISELVREGWLERHPGKGTFVKREHVENLGRLTGFFEEIRSSGHRPSARLLSTRELTVTTALLNRHPELAVFGGQKLFLVEKVHLMDGNPVVYVKSFWPVKIGRSLLQYNLQERGLYEIVHTELDIALETARQDISAGAADSEVAAHLGLAPGAPVLVMSRLVYSNERPVEYSYNAYRPDRYKYRVELKRDLPNPARGVIIEP
ncbi:MAG: GntR family transcriptional regulator [Desulfurispora sp.]|uniref:GntR family transcriptional regulator n=1 Tax=Desulfurispora sp. TaxID=3014275 RepID=UPI00404AE168